jgi:hypothetical protein
MLAVAAQEAMRNPAAVFRNPEKLAQARRLMDEQHDLFVELFGADLVVVAGSEVSGKIREFYHHVARQVSPDAEAPDPVRLGLDEDEFIADRVAIHFVPGEGLNFYPDFHLVEEAFANPALLARRRYRETLTDLLRDPEISPEPLRQLAARDADKTNAMFEKLRKRKRGFRWDTEGEALLRRHKPSYFDGSQLPAPCRSPRPCPTPYSVPAHDRVLHRTPMP